MHVITTVEPERVPATNVADARLVWIGLDDRGIALEIVALDLEDAGRRHPRHADRLTEVKR